MTFSARRQQASNNRAIALAKAEMRQAHQGLRNERLADGKRAETSNQAIAESVVAQVRKLPRATKGHHVSAYVPLASEPGAGHVLDALADAVDTLWLPVCLPDRQLGWARYDGRESLRTIPAGSQLLHEPTGPVHSGSSIIPLCSLMIIPALAVDTQGFRLGKGAGFYDRALALTESEITAEKIALVFEHELLSHVPHDELDRQVDAVIHEGGYRQLG